MDKIVIGIIASVLSFGIIVALIEMFVENSTPSSPQLITTTSSGIQLWEINVHGREIYFSSKGTYYKKYYQCGKTLCSQNEQIPNAS